MCVCVGERGRGRKVFHHVCEVEQHLIEERYVYEELLIFSYFPFGGSRVSRREGAGKFKTALGLVSSPSLYPLISQFFPTCYFYFYFFFPIEDDASLVSLKEGLSNIFPRRGYPK